MEMPEERGCAETLLRLFTGLLILVALLAFTL
jgi:hypothetical protein